MHWELKIEWCDPYYVQISFKHIYMILEKLNTLLLQFFIFFKNKHIKSANTYSGSTYPNVPAGRVDTWESFSVAKALDSPKSAILACMCSFNKMLEGFKSLWIIGGLQPLCRYSNPATPLENHCKPFQIKKDIYIYIYSRWIIK